MAVAKKKAASKAAELVSPSFEADLEKETKNTYKFAEDEAETGLVCGPIYVQKSSFDGVVPGRIRVTIEVLSEYEGDE